MSIKNFLFLFFLSLFAQLEFAKSQNDEPIITDKQKNDISLKAKKPQVEDLSKKGIYVKEKERNYRNVISPRSMGHDSRFKTFTYTKSGVYKVIVLYDNPTFIEFAPDEKLTTVIIPKKQMWQTQVTENRIFLKPLLDDANTEMTIFTDKRQYFFELYAQEPDETGLDKEYAFYYKFHYLSSNEQKTIRKYAKSILPEIDKNPEKYNFNYTITGEVSLYPIKIFDDGEFTYFEFAKYGRLPAIFSVDTNNFEGLVNFRMVGNYVVVEETAPRFTLRNGVDIVCVFNEELYTKYDKKKSKMFDYKNKQKEIEAPNAFKSSSPLNNYRTGDVDSRMLQVNQKN